MSSEMLEEIRQLEVETFEVEDLPDAEQDLGIQSFCSIYCSTSQIT